MDYGKPEILDHGDLMDLTAGAVSGTVTDAKFEAGTPASAITFTN